MKKFLLLFFTFSLFTTHYCGAQGLWTQRTSMDTAIAYNISFAVGNYGYVGLGTDGSSYFDDLWQFAPSTNTWTRKADFPGTIRICPAVFVIGHKAYVVTGTNSAYTSLSECWVYDADADTWTRKSNFPGPARGYDIGFAIGNKGFIGTGYDIASATTFDDIWEYDTATDTWTQKNNFPAYGGWGRYSAYGFAVGNNGYICFGALVFGGGLLDDIWQYDTTTDSWAQKTSYPPQIDIFGVNGFVIGDNIYMGTGQDSSATCYNWFWKYNTTSDTWTQQTNFPGAPRGLCSAFAIGDTGYFGLGIDSAFNYYNDWYKFYPDTLTTGIENNSSLISVISIYPNPNNGQFNIICSAGQNKVSPYVIEIYNLLGESILTKSLCSPQDNNIINISNQPPGMYLYKIRGQSGELIADGKIIVE